MTNVRIWTKTFTIVTIVNFFIMLSMFQLVVTMANFTMEEYHASSSLAGLVATIFIIGILIGRIICGMIIENLGNKKMLIAGIVFFNVIVCFYFWQSSVSQLIAIRFFHGIGVGVASSAAVTIATKIRPPSRKGEGISCCRLRGILAGGCGA